VIEPNTFPYARHDKVQVEIEMEDINLNSESESDADLEFYDKLKKMKDLNEKKNFNK
jgi:hypothetical protein